MPILRKSKMKLNKYLIIINDIFIKVAGFILVHI